MAKYVVTRFEHDLDAEVYVDAVKSGDTSQLDTVLQFEGVRVEFVGRFSSRNNAAGVSWHGYKHDDNITRDVPPGATHG